MIQLPKWTLAVAVVLSLLPAAVRAQPVFWDDFESFQLLQSSPPGKWSNVALTGTSSITLVPAAAHRGDAGLRAIDADPSAVAYYTAAHFYFPANITSGDVYLPYWFRLSPSSPDGGTSILLVGGIGGHLVDGGNISTGGDVVADVQMELPSTRTCAYGQDRVGGQATDPSDSGMTLGPWHLVEIAVKNLGSDAGVRALWIDRGLVAAAPRAFNEVVVQSIRVGENWSDVGNFIGVIDVDDVRLSRTPPASGVQLSVGVSQVDAGDCVPISVTLLDSSGFAAAAPYDLDVALEPDGGSIQVLAADCATPAAGAHFTTGQTAGAAWVRPGTIGTLTLTASHTDFLSGSASLSVVDGGPLALNVGCDCASAGSGLALALAAVVAAAHRRRRGMASLKATGLILLSLSAAARAQDIVESDFDDGGVAQWSTLGPPQPGSSMQVTASAAHRGAYGLRFVDGTATGASTNAYLWKNFLLDGGVFDVNIRTWIRVVAADAGPNYPEILKLGGTIPPSTNTIASMDVTLGFLQCSISDRNGVMRYSPVDPGPDAGRWFLLEQLAWGIGSGDGGASSYIDGQPTGAVTNIDWAGVAVTWMGIGEQYGQPGWLGTMDFDDVRVSRFPMASTLRVSAPASADAGECIQAAVSFWSTDLRAAGAPYDLDVALEADGGGIQVLEADCATPSAGAHFTVGQPAGVAWVRPGTTGTLTLTARHTDFLSGSTSLSVGDGGAASGGPLALNVGCDCASAGSGLALAFLVVVAAAHRRRPGGARGPEARREAVGPGSDA